MNNHNTSEYTRKPNSKIPTCSYCKVPGHNIMECRKKAYNENSKIENKSESSNFYVRKIACNYCKKPGHVIAECRKWKYNKERQEKALQASNTPQPPTSPIPRKKNQ